MGTSKEATEKLVAALKEWQKMEADSISMANNVSKKTENKIIRQVMDIIRHDSAMHKQVQQLIIDSLEKEALSITPEEVAEIWDLVEAHGELEHQVVEMAEKLSGQTKLLVQKYFLDYLLEDEKKHDKLLDQLNGIKKGMYPYG